MRPRQPKRGAQRRRWPNHKMPVHDWLIAEMRRLRIRNRGDIRHSLRRDEDEQR